MYTGWRNLKRSKPPVNELVCVSHKVSGIGAPEIVFNEWRSTGRMRATGTWSINATEVSGRKIIAFPQTHWRKLEFINKC